MDQCYIGGVDFFSSSNGGTSWTQISKWSNNANLNTLNCSLVHADQHNFIFRPGLPNEVVICNDGGVYYTSNLSSAPTSSAFSERNLNYNVTQFYTAALHPTIKDYMLGGTQDNGTPKFTSPGLGSTVDVYGGDGAMCFIDQKDPNFQIASYIYNVIGLSTNGGSSFNTKLIDDDKNGNFINQGDYDSNLKILFTSRSNSAVYRVKNVTTTRDIDSVKITGLGSLATALRISPYSTTASNLYVGTQSGKLFKLLNANATPTITEITGTLPSGTISSIAFGANENQIMVTFYNYGVVNIWETRNGGSSWVNREGNLPNMPVRWAEYHPQNFDQMYIATELGVWTTDNLNTASPVWSSTNGGLANVRTDMLRVRSSDGTIMAATYGRGVFTALIPSQLDQTISFAALLAKNFGDAAIDLTASSTSSLPITYASSNVNVAKITATTLTLTGAGTSVITASQAGNNYYKAATAVSQAITVTSGNVDVGNDLDFGDVILKLTNEKTVTIKNTGNGVLTISAIQYPAGFSGDQTSGVLQPGTNLTVKLLFAPTQAKSFSDTMKIVSNSFTGKGKLKVTGKGLLITAFEDSAMEGFSVYPNPTTGLLFIKTKMTIGNELELADVKGQAWKEKITPLNDNIAQVDISRLASGIYFIVISTQTGSKVKRIIKQ